MTGTTQPKSHEKASTNTNKNTIGTVNIDNIGNMSKNPTPCRTMRPPKTSSFRTMPTPTINANLPASDRQPSHLQSGLPPCCMHVLQAKGQVHKSGEMPALKKVQHPHNGRTSVSRFPLMKQEILSQYSGCFEGIGRFPGDQYKFHLKPDHKPA